MSGVKSHTRRVRIDMNQAAAMLYDASRAQAKAVKEACDIKMRELKLVANRRKAIDADAGETDFNKSGLQRFISSVSTESTESERANLVALHATAAKVALVKCEVSRG